jgi:hypothetical protein
VPPFLIKTKLGIWSDKTTAGCALSRGPAHLDMRPRSKPQHNEIDRCYINKLKAEA